MLRWYLDAGVDEAIRENPVDRYAAPPPQAPVARPKVPEMHAVERRGARPIASRRRPLRRPPPTAASRSAQPSPTRSSTAPYALARRAASLEDLRAALAGFDACPLSKTATNLVFGDGSPQARIVLVGEAPGEEEDRQGKPFVGPSGRLLDRMLASVALDRTKVFITNTVFWRPPGNRSPTSTEVATCMPFLERIIEIIDPAVVIALGGPAAGALLGQSESVGRLRGRWFTFQTAQMPRPVPATAIYHPAYLLRSPAQKRLAWRDLLAIRRQNPRFLSASNGSPTSAVLTGT